MLQLDLHLALSDDVEVTAWLTLVLNLFALQREWRVLGENNRLIAEAALRREDTPGPRQA